MLLQQKQLVSLKSPQLCTLVSFKGTALLILLVSDFLTYVMRYVFGLLTDLMQETDSCAITADCL
jgi:hypothetical protein